MLALSIEDCTLHPVEAYTNSVAPGLCRSSAQVDLRLSIHLGAPAETVLCEGRTQRRFLRVHGGMNIVPPGVDCRWLIKSPLQQLIVRVPSQTLASVGEELGMQSERVNLRGGYQTPDARIEHIVRALQVETVEGYPMGRLFTDSLSIALCAQLLRKHSERAPAPDRRSLGLSPGQYARVIEFIDVNLGHSKLTLPQLASVAGTGITQFKDAFRVKAGRPVHRYVIERRVEYAARLLAAGAPISDAAAEAGFAHGSHLARWMRRLMKVTPRQLRRRA